MASTYFGKANEEFVNENYQKAYELFTEALKEETVLDDVYCNRAQTLFKLDRYKEALEDADEAINLNPKNKKAYLRKGVALFYLEDYPEAKKVLEEGFKLDSEDNNLKTWIRKCEAEIDLSKQKGASEKEPVLVGSSETVNNTPVDKPVSLPAAGDNNLSKPESKPLPMPPKEKSRYDWYQTATHVVITILLKNTKQEDLTTNIQERSLSVTVKLEGGNDYSLELDLSHPIDPAQSITKVLKSKIEVKVKKLEGIHWNKLEGEEPTAVKRMMADPAVTRYPTSSQHAKNWDKLALEVAEEEKGEKKEGDAALNGLFQMIYADGTDETKKAMMKSFYESGGTVLSTNWSEVGKEKVEVKPPDGMEFKKWDS